MISAQEMLTRLNGVQKGQRVFVSYVAGRPPTARAEREAQKADDEGYSKRWFEGSLESVWVTKKGEPVMTVLSTTRYNQDDPTAEAHYRTFNPALGCLLTLEILG
jgi:hypothetical protein